MQARSSPLASEGVEGVTTTRPGTWLKYDSTLWEW